MGILIQKPFFSSDFFSSTTTLAASTGAEATGGDGVIFGTELYPDAGAAAYFEFEGSR